MIHIDALSAQMRRHPMERMRHFQYVGHKTYVESQLRPKVIFTTSHLRAAGINWAP